MHSSLASALCLLITLIVCAPAAAGAQVAHSGVPSPLLPGDSVRVWSGSPSPFLQFEGALRWHRNDSLAFTGGTVVPTAAVSRLQVRRHTERRSIPRLVAGSVLGLGAGALIGGVIGYGATGGFDGQNRGYGDGMGVIVGVPAGAALGMVVGGVVGGRKRRSSQWVDVSLAR